MGDIRRWSITHVYLMWIGARPMYFNAILVYMARPWNYGLTKDTHPSLRKTSHTMRMKRIDNFAQWRTARRNEGLLVSRDNALEMNGDLAELLGLILGDGNITKFPRTECLRIVINSKHNDLVKRCVSLVKAVFQKTPHVAQKKTSNAINVTLYQCYLSQRLGIPAGARANFRFSVPAWIDNNPDHTRRFLRGLYEAERSHSVHVPTHTFKLQFSNTNPFLLEVVFRPVKRLGFHPHRSRAQIQVSRREEVQNLIHLIQFRSY